MKNLKKVISSVAALTIVASSASAFALTFPDVDSSASYANAVDTLVALGIVNGDDNGLFNPDNEVTRAEFTKMAVGALGELAAAEAQSTSKFADAANTQVHWAAGYVAQGVADGFIDGYDDTTFGPDDKVTYAQACKMLVAAVGYTTYAEAQGGWPSGYVAQASSLGISKGVSAQNDVNLTRAQVAVLINNAMQVPLNVIDTYETKDSLTGSYQAPVYKKKDGIDKEYQTLLTDRHDAYVVKGRVTATAQSGDLEKDEVQYKVEVADNFDDVTYTAKDSKNGNDWEDIVKVGDTNAADMLFAYTEAIIQKDEDSDEYTILSITNYGNSKTVEFAADDVADDDSFLTTDKDTDKVTGYAAKAQIPVYKNSSSSTTTKYDLDDPVYFYVNGKEVEGDLDDLINTYILNNSTGTVTLVDQTDVGSTSTDGDYDYIMVDYYVDAVVENVTTSSSTARVYFKAAQNGATRMQWDLDDEDIDITFTKNGAEIAYTDLAEWDVLSIKYDVEDGNFTDLDYAKVLVSDSTVTGTVGSKDTTDWTITIDGTEYDAVRGLVSVSNDKEIELGTEYTAYIDAFGYIAYTDEGDGSSKNYGVITAMTKSSDKDYSSVRIVTADGSVVTYECKDEDAETAFYNFLTGLGAEGSSSNKTVSKTALGDYITKGQTAVSYKLSGGKIKSYEALDNSNGGKELEYKASSNKVGSYSISSVTKIVDMSDYMKDNTVSTMTAADFEDEVEYTGYFYAKNSNSDYRFAVIFDGASSLRPATQIAVVKKANGTTEVDSNRCDVYTVARAKDEEVTLYVDEDIDDLAEGAVVAYKVGSEGYVEDDADIKVIFTPSDEYDQLLSKVIGNDVFGASLKNAKAVSTNAGEKDYGAYNLTYGNDEDVKVYLGVAYRKSASSVELMLGADTTYESTAATSLKYTKDFSLSGANLYTFDYTEGRLNKGTRLTIGNSGTQATTIFNPISVDDDNYIKWDTAKIADNEIEPQIVLVKEDDGDVTDVVFYVK